MDENVKFTCAILLGVMFLCLRLLPSLALITMYFFQNDVLIHGVINNFVTLPFFFCSVWKNFRQKSLNFLWVLIESYIVVTEQIDSTLLCDCQVIDYVTIQNMPHETIAECVTDVLTTSYYVICDQLQNRRTPTWSANRPHFPIVYSPRDHRSDTQNVSKFRWWRRWVVFPQECRTVEMMPFFIIRLKTFKKNGEKLCALKSS